MTPAPASDPLQELEKALAMPRGVAHRFHGGYQALCETCKQDAAFESALRSASAKVREALEQRKRSGALYAMQDDEVSEVVHLHRDAVNGLRQRLADIEQERDAARAEVATLKALLGECPMLVDERGGMWLEDHGSLRDWIARRNAVCRKEGT